MPHAFVLVCVFPVPNGWSSERCAKNCTQATALFSMALHDFLVALNFSLFNMRCRNAHAHTHMSSYVCFFPTLFLQLHGTRKTCSLWTLFVPSHSFSMVFESDIIYMDRFGSSHILAWCACLLRMHLYMLMATDPVKRFLNHGSNFLLLSG